MRYSAGLIAAALFATLPTACQKASPEIDACEAIKQAPKVIGSPVVVTGWYGSGYHWAGIGSGGCAGLIEVQFGKKPAVTVQDPKDKHAEEARKLLAQGLPTFWDFRARFTGVLRKRSVAAPFSPSLGAMPYVLDVTSIDGLQIERAPWRSRPPPQLTDTPPGKEDHSF
jgi:hypothetical protein